MEAANLDIATTGPWEIDDHRTGEFWRMKAVEDHWRKTLHFAEMVFWQIPEEAALMAAIDTEAIIETLLRGFGRLALLHDYVGNEHRLDPDKEG